MKSDDQQFRDMQAALVRAEHQVALYRQQNLDMSKALEDHEHNESIDVQDARRFVRVIAAFLDPDSPKNKYFVLLMSEIKLNPTTLSEVRDTIDTAMRREHHS